MIIIKYDNNNIPKRFLLIQYNSKIRKKTKGLWLFHPVITYKELDFNRHFIFYIIKTSLETDSNRDQLTKSD